MAHGGETVTRFDGTKWSLYTERRGDLARFEEWFGPPERRGQGNKCASWEGIPADAIRLRRRNRREPKEMSPEQRAALKARLDPKGGA